ncbi:MAG: hypothetical protein HY812_09685 [Planctomycetes bacterium]|nr:hypothetical protein [Planctomycetota bacterium]
MKEHLAYDWDAAGEPDGLSVVIAALESLENAPVISQRDAVDPDRVADVLLDVGHRFDGTRLLYLMTALQLDRFDDLACEMCAREYLLLDAEGLAEEAVVAVYTGWVDGTRRQPFGDWARRIVRHVVRRACVDPKLAVYSPPGGDAAERLVMEILAEKANRLDFEVRRVVWFSWVEHMRIPEIARVTGMPFERVEWVLASVMEETQKTVKDLLEGKLRRESEAPGDDWSIEEKEGGHGA